MTSPRRSLALALTVAVTAMWLATCPAAAGQEQSRKVQAKEHFLRGSALYAEHAYDKAIKEYVDAFALFPVPDFLFNIAQAYRAKGDGSTALVFYRRYLDKAPDINTWAVAGPGAIRGLHRLHGRNYKTALRQEQACEEMCELLELSKMSLPDFIPRLELREIEHSLCETDKWLRVAAGQGLVSPSRRPSKPSRTRRA